MSMFLENLKRPIEAIGSIFPFRRPISWRVSCIKCNREAVVAVRDVGEPQLTPGIPVQWCQLIFGNRVFQGCPDCFPLDSSSNEVLLEFAQACAQSSTLW